MFMKIANKEQPWSGRGNRYSSSFHDRMISFLIEKGCSEEGAEVGFRMMFRLIVENIQCGEVLNLPGMGIIKAVPWDDKQQKHEERTEKSPRILFMPDQPLDLTPPRSPAEIETQALSAEIGCPLWAWFWIVCTRKCESL